MHQPRRHLSSRPFMAAPRIQFYHPARVIDAALHGIDRAIRRAEGIALVVGPPGTGKSLLLSKVAESVGEDFKAALLSGARICTRRALWQSILADLGQPYRGIDEAELRIAVVEVVRGLAAAGSGLVILVDEAHTLPLRLIEELRLLANMPTPLPAVHIVLAGTSALEERLGSPKMDSFTQRIAARAYLESLDHAETVAYLRTQMKAAGLDWDKSFEPACDDAVFRAADGVPRLINQICDQALVLVSETGRRVKPADIAAAWREIQRLPSSSMIDCTGTDEPGQEGFVAEREPAADRPALEDLGGEGGVGVIEFGGLDDDDDTHDGIGQLLAELQERGDGHGILDIHTLMGHHDDVAPAEGPDPWHGPDVEFVFEASTDPFQEFFAQEERIVERYLVRSPDDFSRHQHVTSCEGAALVRHLAELEDIRPTGGAEVAGVAEVAGGRCGDSGFGCAEAARQHAVVDGPASAGSAGEMDDADMVVIEEDLLALPGGLPAVAAVRLGDYRRLFARLRRGG
ncbi:MAG: AAA family ATPase [Planctomycetes bacterium]|nr:AAA family ATPase [Planctomycetota bacterium]